MYLSFLFICRLWFHSVSTAVLPLTSLESTESFSESKLYQLFGVNVNKHLRTHCSKCNNWFDTCFIANGLLHFLMRSPSFMCSAWLHYIVVFGFVLFCFSFFHFLKHRSPYTFISVACLLNLTAILSHFVGVSVKCAQDGGPWRMVEGKCIWQNMDEKCR